MMAITTLLFAAATPSAFAEVPQVQSRLIPKIQTLISQIEIPDIGIQDDLPFARDPPMPECEAVEGPIRVFDLDGTTIISWGCRELIGNEIIRLS